MKKPIPIVKLSLTIMRITLLHIVLSAAFSGFALASSTSSSFGQGILDKTFSLNVENKRLRGVLLQIEKSTLVKFSFNPKSIPVDQKISVGFRNKTLKFVLDSLLTPLQVGYEVSDNYVILNKTQAVSSDIRANSVDEVIVDRLVSGIVLDENNAPLPGVNVLEKGTTKGTTTDANGRFSLSMEDESTTLVFSFIGYTTQEVPVGTQTEISVTLQPDIQSLNEVVIVAYGTQQKKDLTSSISSLKAKDLGNIPVSSADALLQGKAAGVQVVQNSGQPGGEVFVRIRGSSSLYGESRPLFVIDGVPMTNTDAQPLGGGGQRFSALADINPNDIESMEVLKDAAAAALYGSRGSNGVVLITTKRGKTGDARISFDAYYGVQNVIKKFDLLDGQGYIDVVNEGNVNRGLPPFTELTNTGVETNWQNEVFRSAPIANYNISVSGGSDRLTAFLSLGYFKQSGTLIGQEFDRINGRLNLEYQAKKYLKVGASTTFSTSNTDRVDADFSSYSVLGNALFFNPNVPVFDDAGNYGQDPLPVTISSNENPVMIANDLTHNILNRRLITNIYGEVAFLKHFTLRSTFGIDFITRREERFIPSYFRIRQGSAESGARFYDELIWQNENVLQYSNQFGNHSFGALLGYSLLESTASSFSITGSTTGSDIITSYSAILPNNNQPQHNIGSWGLRSLFSRFNYGFKDKYLVEASIRQDGSSRFGRNNRFGYFPAVSAGWRVSSEPFMEGISNVVNELKLRASYGVTGNQDGLDNFASLAQYASNANYDGRPAIYLQALGNPDLKWESTVTTNIGLDIGFLQDRFNLNVDAYIKATNDLFYTLTLPATTGFTQVNRFNLGSLENRGIELSLMTRNLVGKFKWTTNFNIAFNRNEVTELIDVNGITDRRVDPVNFSGAEGPYGLFRVGEPVGNFFGYKYLGVWGDPNNRTIPDGWGTRVRNGGAIYEDVNGDFNYGRVDDMQLIGNALPLHIGGITNTFTYMGVDLSIVMNWSYGNDIYNATRAVMEGLTAPRNQLATTENRWSTDNPDGTMPYAISGANSSINANAANTDASSRFIEDGSFLRVRNITLGYNLPSSVVQKIALANARIYLSAQNLFTFTNYSGLDPESQNLGTSQGGLPSIGVDFLTQPQPRVIMAGINIGF